MRQALYSLLIATTLALPATAAFAVAGGDGGDRFIVDKPFTETPWFTLLVALSGTVIGGALSIIGAAWVAKRQHERDDEVRAEEQNTLRRSVCLALSAELDANADAIESNTAVLLEMEETWREILTKAPNAKIEVGVRRISTRIFEMLDDRVFSLPPHILHTTFIAYGSLRIHSEGYEGLIELDRVFDDKDSVDGFISTHNGVRDICRLQSDFLREEAKH